MGDGLKGESTSAYLSRSTLIGLTFFADGADERDEPGRDETGRDEPGRESLRTILILWKPHRRDQLTWLGCPAPSRFALKIR